MKNIPVSSSENNTPENIESQFNTVSGIQSQIEEAEFEYLVDRHQLMVAIGDMKKRKIKN